MLSDKLALNFNSISKVNLINENADDIFFLLSCIQLYGQDVKKPLVLGQTLSYISDEHISNNGNYIIYKTNGAPTFLTLFDVRTQENTHLPFDAFNALFDANSTHLYFAAPGDSLCMVSLASKKLEVITGVRNFTQKDYGKNTWLHIENADSNNSVELRCPSLRKSYQFIGVISSRYFDQSTKVLLQMKRSDGLLDLLLLDLNSGTKDSIWVGKECSMPTVSQDETHFAFVCTDTTNGGYCIQNYDLKTGKTKVIATDQDNLLKSAKLVIKFNGFPFRYTNSDSSLLFTCSTAAIQPVLAKQGLDIYRYNEDRAYKLSGEVSNFIVAVNIVNGKKLVLTGENDAMYHFVRYNKHIVKSYSPIKVFGANWQDFKSPALLITSLINGVTDTVRSRGFLDAVTLSPDGDFLIFYDRDQYQFFSYNISTKTLRNLTQKIAYSLYEEEEEFPVSAPAYGIAAWNSQKKTVLIYDRYDIWELDYTGHSEPVNVTYGAGRTSNITFRLLRFSYENQYEPIDLNGRKTVYLSSTDNSNKQQGVYVMKGMNRQQPQKLFNAAAIFSKVAKAKFANAYLIKKESADLSPNVFFTTDLKTLEQVSFLDAHRGLNWLTSELISIKVGVNPARYGVLYKPQNFNVNKKYPLIFYVYDKYSSRLNEYLYPKIHGSIIDIPYYVSNGYCVFVPDLHYTVGSPGKSVATQLDQWVDTMTARSYIDKFRIGIQGHSFGGYEVNFTITQTNKFACAVAASAASDLISQVHSGNFSTELIERGQTRLGKPFFAAPELYASNSPIYHVGKVSTPLLLMTGTNDFNVPAFQSREMFYALKRLSKKVWLLEYANDAHVLSDENALDFDTRMKQFFDYFLKGETVPEWF